MKKAEKTDTEHVVFNYNPITGKVKLSLKAKCKLEFSQGLSDILGFDKTGFEAPGNESITEYAPYLADVSRGFNSLYVYCSICEPQIVGDTYVPLLRTVFLTGKQGDIVNNTFVSPHYVPVNSKTFDTIEVNIKNDLNENVSFTTGKLICKLHFRQKAL